MPNARDAKQPKANLKPEEIHVSLNLYSVNTNRTLNWSLSGLPLEIIKRNSCVEDINICTTVHLAEEKFQKQKDSGKNI